MKRKAFTLVEMLIVVVVLCIAAAILLPSFGGHSARLSVNRRNCASNLRHLGLAFRVYASDYDDKFPSRAANYDGWVQQLSSYIQNPPVFTCPSSTHQRQGATDYFTNARLAAIKRTRVISPKSVILSGDGNELGWPSAYLTTLPKAWRTNENSPAHRHFDAANYLFADGHVQSAKPDQITLDKPSANRPTFLIR